MFSCVMMGVSRFQLTPSRRATVHHRSIWSNLTISTHALTEGDALIEHVIPLTIISTHALTEGDWNLIRFCVPVIISTHALTEGDYAIFKAIEQGGISTHALTEGDRKF